MLHGTILPLSVTVPLMALGVTVWDPAPGTGAADVAKVCTKLIELRSMIENMRCRMLRLVVRLISAPSLGGSAVSSVTSKKPTVIQTAKVLLRVVTLLKILVIIW